MAYSFANTGGTEHSLTLIGLEDGDSYSYYVRCGMPRGISTATTSPLRLPWRAKVEFSGFRGLFGNHAIDLLNKRVPLNTKKGILSFANNQRLSRASEQHCPAEDGAMMETAKRRSDRVLIALPVSVSGIDAEGKPFTEETATVTVSQHGAAIAFRTPLVPGQEITVRRHRIRTRVPLVAECYVAAKMGAQLDRLVFSVAFRKPAEGFWDIYFPPLPPGRDIAGRALLYCKSCGSHKVVHFDKNELAEYIANRQLSLHCSTCGRSTIWLESEQQLRRRPELKSANLARLAAMPSAVAHNQRKHSRVCVEIPVCIRQVGWDDDLATTVDISRGGLRFSSKRAYAAGSYIQVAVPYSHTAVNVFVDARVVHSAKLASENVYRFGIMYLAENEAAS
jgi:PilZ domain